MWIVNERHDGLSGDSSDAVDGLDTLDLCIVSGETV
jgi:hypothetical protein